MNNLMDGLLQVSLAGRMSMRTDIILQLIARFGRSAGRSVLRRIQINRIGYKFPPYTLTVLADEGTDTMADRRQR